MIPQVEISSFDLRFEGYRLRNKVAERILLASILENGIRDPLQGVDMEHARILLNGFKRRRCAKRLGIAVVPYVSLSTDTGAGIIELLRMSNEKGLGILEQARLIEALKDGHQMGTADIAFGLAGLRDISRKAEGRSKAEQAMLRDLELTQVYMQRVTARSKETGFKSRDFFAQANLLTGGILRQMDLFTHAVREFHDRSGKA